MKNKYGKSTTMMVSDHHSRCRENNNDLGKLEKIEQHKVNLFKEFNFYVKPFDINIEINGLRKVNIFIGSHYSFFSKNLILGFIRTQIEKTKYIIGNPLLNENGFLLLDKYKNFNEEFKFKDPYILISNIDYGLHFDDMEILIKYILFENKEQQYFITTESLEFLQACNKILNKYLNSVMDNKFDGYDENGYYNVSDLTKASIEYNTELDLLSVYKVYCSAKKEGTHLNENNYIVNIDRYEQENFMFHITLGNEIRD